MFCCFCVLLFILLFITFTIIINISIIIIIIIIIIIMIMIIDYYYYIYIYIYIHISVFVGGSLFLVSFAVSLAVRQPIVHSAFRNESFGRPTGSRVIRSMFKCLWVKNWCPKHGQQLLYWLRFLGG